MGKVRVVGVRTLEVFARLPQILLKTCQKICTTGIGAVARGREAPERGGVRGGAHSPRGTSPAGHIPRPPEANFLKIVALRTSFTLYFMIILWDFLCAISKHSSTGIHTGSLVSRSITNAWLLLFMVISAIDFG